ncbi:MAG: PAS domain-containing protein, partial [Pirellulales bacterium]
MVGKQTPGIMHLEAEVAQRGEELTRELGRKVHGFEVFVAFAREGRHERREWTYVRKDGSHLTVNLVVTAVKNAAGEITGFLGVAEDISERKKSEEALRKSEERFNLAVAGSNDGLWDWDVRSKEVYYSPRFKELLGYGETEFENIFDSFEAHLHPDDREITLAAVRYHLQDGQTYDVEYRLRTRSGEYRWFRARGQAVWDKTGQAVRMAGSLTDITERKKTEAALQRYASDIQLANETLRAAESEALNAVLKRDQFLAMLSHELRNPLSAILHGAGVLGHKDADDKAVARARRAIQQQAQQMSRLLDDLLDVARITQGKIEFRKEVLDLNELVREALQASKPAMESRQQRLAVIATHGPVMVECDPTRLLQVVENLLSNASKYTPVEGVITIEIREEVNECILSVQDNGLGIDPDKLEKIFDLFFQSNKAIDRSDGGIGVGLTLVRTLVEMHGGTVIAHSDGLGLGSRFVIRLPLSSKTPAKPAEQISATAGGEIRVLIVEDNPGSRDMLQTILTLEGYQVEVAEDGQQGLEAIVSQRPDVALIDIGLPKLNGYEVACRVRTEIDRSEVRLIALTGYGQAQDREAAFQAGFDEHLVKPVNPDELARILRTAKKHR